MLIESEKIVTLYFFLLLEKYRLASIPGMPKSFFVIGYFLPACHLVLLVLISLCCLIASIAETCVARTAGITAEISTVTSATTAAIKTAYPFITKSTEYGLVRR